MIAAVRFVLFVLLSAVGAAAAPTDKVERSAMERICFICIFVDVFVCNAEILLLLLFILLLYILLCDVKKLLLLLKWKINLLPDETVLVNVLLKNIDINDDNLKELIFI
jgi:hypothetical protein